MIQTLYPCSYCKSFSLHYGLLHHSELKCYVSFRREFLHLQISNYQVLQGCHLSMDKFPWKVGSVSVADSSVQLIHTMDIQHKCSYQCDFIRVKELVSTICHRNFFSSKLRESCNHCRVGMKDFLDCIVQPLPLYRMRLLYCQFRHLKDFLNYYQSKCPQTRCTYKER